MPTLILTLVALGTLAFGAVYPWAYVPLLAAAAAVGIAGLIRGGLLPALRPLAAGFAVLCAAAAVQLVPLPAPVVELLSPFTPGIVNDYDLGFESDAAWIRLSIDPARTLVAVAALGALGLYVLGCPALLDGPGLRTLPRGLAFIAVPVALFAIYTREFNNGLIYGFWPSLDGGGADQAGPFINRNHFGGWIVMALCVMLGGLLGTIERTLPSADFYRRRTNLADEAGGVLLMVGAIVLGTISLFWIVSRSAIGGFVVAMAVFAWLVLTRQRMGTVPRALVMVTLAVVVLAGVSWRGVDVLLMWFLDERSLLSRLDAWRDGWAVVRDFPLLGTGLNTYSPAMLFYQVRNPGFHMAQAHNDYLQLLAEGGTVIGIAVVAVAVLMGRSIWWTLRAARAEARGYWVRAGATVGLVAIAFQELVEFTLQIPVNAFLFCTLAAIALTPVGTRAAGGVRPRANIDLPEESSGVALS